MLDETWTFSVASIPADDLFAFTWAEHDASCICRYFFSCAACVPLSGEPLASLSARLRRPNTRNNHIRRTLNAANLNAAPFPMRSPCTLPGSILRTPTDGYAADRSPTTLGRVFASPVALQLASGRDPSNHLDTVLREIGD
jgi:hypothetical protein